MKIYVVFGTTGEWSDRSEWTVKAFINEDKAKELVLKATEIANTWFQKVENDEIYRWDLDGKNEFDPKFHMDYTGTTYYYEEIYLDEKT